MPLVPMVAALQVCGAALGNAPGLALENPVVVSRSEGHDASKAKLIRLAYAEQGEFRAPLVIVYTDGVGPIVRAYDGSEHAAGDVFATRSLDDGATWSPPDNLSGTATLCSVRVDHDGDPRTAPRPFPGDSQKPMLFGSGRDVVVAWVDAFCPTGSQRTVTYELEKARARVEVPYYAVYAVRSTDGGATWSSPQRLSDGARDARQCMVRGTGAGWALVWQEDPRGLQPGEGLGCGPGGSGAKVSPGTDVWLTTLASGAFRSGAPFPAPRRLTDNFTRIGRGPRHGGYESGRTGASRPSLALAGDTLVVAYEETKGLGDAGAGKFVRYHVLSAFDDSRPDPTDGAGWIVSDPRLNARRARVVPAGSPAGGTGLKLCLLFRQGPGGHAADAAIAARVARGGHLPQDLLPGVSPDATTYAAALDNEAALLLSDEPGDPALANAWAHRAIIVGDAIVVGYCRTPRVEKPSGSVLIGADLFVRRSLDGGLTWTAPRNLSNAADAHVTVAEPRLARTPGSPDPDEPRDTSVFYASWGTQEFRPTGEQELAPHLDVYLTGTADGGDTYAPPVVLAGGPEAELESQIRCTPDGARVFAVWQAATAARSVIWFRAARGKVAQPADLNGDGRVDEVDLAILCARWAGRGAGDLDGDGSIDFDDLLALTDAWR